MQKYVMHTSESHQRGSNLHETKANSQGIRWTLQLQIRVSQVVQQEISEQSRRAYSGYWMSTNP